MTGNSDFYLPTWLRWLLGAITFLAIAILILSVVLGVRAGQQQLEIRSRQQIAMSLQTAIDMQAQGDIEAAFNAYRGVLILDPNNPTATEGIQALLDAGGEGNQLAQSITTGGGAQSGQQSNQAAGQNTGQQTAQSQAQSAPAPVAASSKEVALYDDAQKALQAQEWQTVVDALSELRTSNPSYQSAEVTEQLYTAHLTLAAEFEARNDVESAIANYDAAIDVHPSPIGAEVGKELLNKYIELLAIDDSDHWRLIAALEGIYQADRTYRDIGTRLQTAYVKHGDALVSEKDWCLAITQYDKAADLDITPGLNSKRNRYRQQCDDGDLDDGPTQPSLASAALTLRTDKDEDAESDATNSGTTNSGVTSQNRTTRIGAAATTPNAATSSSASSSASESGVNPSTARAAAVQEAEKEDDASPPVGVASGRILYSAQSIADNRFRVFSQPVSGAGNAAVLVDDGNQPAFRADGNRLIYSNLRSDAIGLTAFDPASGLTLRFTDFAEDSFPSWSPDGNRIVFASTREGDRRWRIFTVWAEESGATTNHSFGETPSWHPTQDLIVYRGCDERGNACGLWSMDGNGGSRRPLTAVVQDSHPAWSPDGRSLVFMSSGRHGNPEIYRLATSNGQVTRLTNSPSIDGIPAVSPSGDWVAFLSDRNGTWGIWRVPISGGTAQVVAPLAGQPGEWQSQTLQWVP